MFIIRSNLTKFKLDVNKWINKHLIKILISISFITFNRINSVSGWGESSWNPLRVERSFHLFLSIASVLPLSYTLCSSEISELQTKCKYLRNIWLDLVHISESAEPYSWLQYCALPAAACSLVTDFRRENELTTSRYWRAL